jgi:MFS family permease
MLMWAAGVYAVAAVGVGLAPNFGLALTCLLIVTAAMGVVGPVRQAYIHKVVPTQQRATVVSFDSMIANVGGIGGQGGLGYLTKVRDYSTGYIVGGAFTVLALPLFYLLRKVGEDADKIIGKPGKHSPCAAQGIAATGAMDDKLYAAAKPEPALAATIEESHE